MNLLAKIRSAHVLHLVTWLAAGVAAGAFGYRQLQPVWFHLIEADPTITFLYHVGPGLLLSAVPWMIMLGAAIFEHRLHSRSDSQRHDRIPAEPDQSKQ